MSERKTPLTLSVLVHLYGPVEVKFGPRLKGRSAKPIYIYEV